ncbi:MAG: hypothetical protein AAF577_09390 [Pseudomonadota bacterium]
MARVKAATNHAGAGAGAGAQVSAQVSAEASAQASAQTGTRGESAGGESPAAGATAQPPARLEKPRSGRRAATNIRRTGALTVLACCFLASAVLRAGDVLAERVTSAPALDALGEAFIEREAPDLVGPARLLRELEARQATLDARESAVAEREAAIAEAETRLRGRLAEIRTAHDALRGALAEARGAADEDVAHLTDVYAQMKPAAAGALFNEMPPDFAAGFLARMPATAAAALLAAMQPDRAYAVSVMLATRRAALANATDPTGDPAPDAVAEGPARDG